MTKSAIDPYREDLAFVHDAGFGGLAQHAATWLAQELNSHGVEGGKIVDLGCGSGILAAALSRAGFDALGIDLSPHMLAIARRRAPLAEFRLGSALSSEIPQCIAVTAIGEVFNYLFDDEHSPRQLRQTFRRVFDALLSGGWFVFDVALVGRVAEGRRRDFSEGPDWACLYEAEEDSRRPLLTRRITSFRQVGKSFRRDHETHTLRLFERPRLVALARKAGFRVRTVRGYGEFPFPAGYVGIIGRKPRESGR